MGCLRPRELDRNHAWRPVSALTFRTLQRRCPLEDYCHSACKAPSWLTKSGSEDQKRMPPWPRHATIISIRQVVSASPLTHLCGRRCDRQPAHSRKYVCPSPCGSSHIGRAWVGDEFHNASRRRGRRPTLVPGLWRRGMVLLANNHQAISVARMRVTTEVQDVALR